MNRTYRKSGIGSRFKYYYENMWWLSRSCTVKGNGKHGNAYFGNSAYACVTSTDFPMHINFAFEI